jgi:hypothetical protein
MAFELMFAPDFFVGPHDEELDYPVDKPKSVYQAIMSLDEETWQEMVEIAFDPCDGCGEKCEACPFSEQRRDHKEGKTNDFISHDEVLEKIRETNTCTDLRTPVEVWIDTEGYCTLKVY